MNQLVFIENGRAVTDTLIISNMFGKTHDNVIRDTRNQIEKLIEAGEEEFSFLNFEESTYTSDRGRNYPKIDMTEDGFVLVAMSYVTPEAMKMKVKFIQEFKRMRERLNNLPASPLKALMQATHNLLASQELIVERLDDVEDKLDNQITLDSGQQRRLQQAINKRSARLNRTSPNAVNTSGSSTKKSKTAGKYQVTKTYAVRIYKECCNM